MRITFMALLCLFSTILMGQNSISIMYYNLLNFPGTSPGRADSLRKILQYSEPDILVVNELISEEGAQLILENSLNVFRESNYNRAVFTNGYDTDNMLFWNKNKLGLYQQNEIETELRLINEYVLYTIPIVNDTVFLSVYSAHLKASDGTDEENQRWAEVKAFKDYLSEKVVTQNIFFGGDLNIYKSSEKAYTEIVSGNGIYLYDPLFMAGSWHNNQNYASIHTQSTRSTQFGGGATGGMDDRFDMIFVSEDILNGANRLKYIEDSYTALGQDGFRFNQSLIGTANQSAPDSVLSALYYMSDHLPVVMEFEILESASAIIELSDFKINYFMTRESIAFSNIEEEVDFQIIDLLGRSVLDEQLPKGDSFISIPKDIKGGTYIFKFFNTKNGATMAEKVFVKR